MGHGHDFTDIHRAIVSGVTDAQSELGDERIGVGLIGIAVGAMGEDEMAKTVDFILDNQVGYSSANMDFLFTKMPGPISSSCADC